MSLEHFMRLAKRGAHGGASGGEKRAFRLAKAVADDVPGLDSQATEGLIEFIKAASHGPQEANDLIEQWEQS